MRRDWPGQPDPLIEDSISTARGKSAHLGSVVVPIDAGLNRFPVRQRVDLAIAADERRGDDGLADAGVGAGYKDAAEQSPASRRVVASRATNSSIVFSDRPTFTEILRRAVPGGTVGGR